MDAHSTNELFQLQPFCASEGLKSFVAHPTMTDMPKDPGKAGLWTKAQRIQRGISAQELSDRINGLAHESGDPTTTSQQVIAKFEKGETKKTVGWHRFIPAALTGSDAETKEDPYLSTGASDDSVSIQRVATHVGMGGGGSFEGDPGVVSFSRDLIERELRVSPLQLLAMVAEGNSMQPEFLGGDQILIDTQKKSLAQPGAFCLWDGDGHVIKYLEKIPDSDPPKVRVVSANSLYEPRERLLEEINLVGRVIWFGRRVQ